LVVVLYDLYFFFFAFELLLMMNDRRLV